MVPRGQHGSNGLLGPPLALAFVVAPANKRGVGERGRTRAIRQACSAAFVVAALLSPWWWPAIGAFRQELANRGDLGLLRQVCKAKAEDVIIRTISGVHDLSIRLPRGSRLRDIWKDPRVIETPLHSRDPVESTWQAPTLGVARFEQAVVEEPVASGGIELHGPAQTARAPLGHLDAGTKSPRYELSWDYIQSNSEQRVGLVGIRTLLTDTASGEVLARRTTYFLRKERVTIYDESVNPMYDACKTPSFIATAARSCLSTTASTGCDALSSLDPFPGFAHRSGYCSVSFCLEHTRKASVTNACFWPRLVPVIHRPRSTQSEIIDQFPDVRPERILEEFDLDRILRLSSQLLVQLAQKLIAVGNVENELAQVAPDSAICLVTDPRSLDPAQGVLELQHPGVGRTIGHTVSARTVV